GGLVTSSAQLFGVPSRSRIMNEPPPVLHRGTMYSCPSGFVSASLPSGLLICQLTSPVPRSPFFSQSTMLTGKTTGRNTPPDSAPATEMASAVEVNCGKPMTRPNVVPNVWVLTACTPCAPDGIDPSPTRAAAARLEVIAPPGVSHLPVTSV